MVLLTRALAADDDKTPVLQVSAGLIFREGKLLIAQRFKEAHVGGLWEFPGGKRECDETSEECLRRELQEELGVSVRVGQLVEEIAHAYPERRVLLRFYRCSLDAGEPMALGCAACKWVSRKELADYDFPAADARLLEKLQNTDRLWNAP